MARTPPFVVAISQGWSRLIQHRRTGAIMLAVSFVIYGVFLGRNENAYAGGSDSSGYLNSARLLSEGRVHGERRFIEGLPPESVPPWTYLPLGFIPHNDRDMVPTYSIGMPLLLAAAAAVTGWDLAPHLVLWIHAMAGVSLMYLLARRAGVSWLGSLVGAAILGCSPLYVLMSTHAMSDVPALVWCTVAVCAAWLSQENPRYALVAGAAVGIAVLVRPTNVLIFLPVAACLGFRWQRWLWLGLGGLPAALVLAVYNVKLYGTVFTTGYGYVDPAFGGHFVGPTLRHYARWLPVLLTPAVLLLAAAPWTVAPERRRMLLVFALWAFPITAFYAFYRHTSEVWWYLRFLLPAFPPVIAVLLLVGLTGAQRLSPGIRGISAVIALAAIVAWSTRWGSHFEVLKTARNERVYHDAARWAQTHLPANSVVMAMQTTGALEHYTSFTYIRWEQVDSALFERIKAACAATQQPIHAVLFPFELDDALKRHLPGPWTQIGSAGHASIWRFDGVSSQGAGHTDAASTSLRP